MFYTAFTQFLGFPKYGDEYKMMGLSAYGEPRFAATGAATWSARKGIRCRLNLDYFIHHTKGVEMTWDGGEPSSGPVFSQKMVEVFGDPRVPRSETRASDTPIWRLRCSWCSRSATSRC